MASKVTISGFIRILSSVCILSINALASLNAQSNFGANNLAILVATSASANNTTVNVVEIDKVTANQSAIQTITIAGTGSDAIRVSGSASSTLYAANSNDGTLFCFTGHNNTNTSSNANTLNPRAVVTVNHSGSATIATTYTGTSGNQTRCATTLNNTNFYIADQGGQFTNGATSSSPTGNLRGIKAFGGTVYVGLQSSTAGIIEVSTTSAITGGTITGLPGLSNNSTFQDFFLISSGDNGSTFDVLYITRNTSATAGTVAKFSLVSGTWTANGTYTTTFGGFGIAAEKSGSGADLFVTSGNGATAANTVRKLVDAAGYNSTINITSTTTLYTAAAGTTIKGIAFAPKAPATPEITVSGSPSGLSTTYGTASSSTSFTVSGTNLTANIVVTPPAGYEVSTDDMTFSPTVSLTPTAGTVSATTIYLRIKATAPVAGSPYSGNIQCTSTGAATQTLATGSGTVNPLNISTTGATAQNKVYDGNNTATITGATPMGVVNGDDISVTGGGTFSQIVPGTNIAVTANLSLTGANASSYNLTQPTGLQADITPKTLTITGITANNKTFDGNTDASLSGTPALVGVIAGDDVTLGGIPVASFDNIGPGTNIPVTVTGYTLSGTEADRYNLQQPTGLTADITPAIVPEITVSGTLTSVNTTYGSPSASPSSFTVSGTNLLDDITITAPTGYEISTNISSGYMNVLTLEEMSGSVAVTTIYVRLKGTATVAGSPYSGDIVCTSASATTRNVPTEASTVSPLTITVSGATAQNKVYDGTTDAVITGATPDGLVNGDIINVTGGGSFDSKNVGTAKAVTAGLSLTGTNASSYTLTQPTGLNADITTKNLTVSGAAAQNKVYDGTTAAVITGTLSGVISGDDVVFNGTGNFNTANIGNNKPVTSTSTLTGADAANYTLTQPTGLTANILPISLATWTYEPLEGTTSNPTPNTGTGSSAIVGALSGAGTGTGMNTATGCGTQTTGTSAWAFSSANPGATNESSGVQYNCSTVGHTDIRFTWEQRWSNTATNTVRLQYTTDGTIWNNFTMTDANTTYCLGTLNNGRFEANTTGDQFRRISVNFSGISAVNNNSNFGVRIVAAHYQNTGQFRQTQTPSNVATAGTWRFDNVKFESYPGESPVPTNVNLSADSSMGTEADATTITITATTEAPVSGTQSISLSVGGTGITAGDYYISSATITIPDGQTTGTVTFTVADDAVHEATETAVISIASVSSGLQIGTVNSVNITIRNNDCSFLRKVGNAASTIGAEIPAFHPGSNRLYVVAATDTEMYQMTATGSLNYIGILSPGFTPPSGFVAEPNSVAVKNNLVAVAYAIKNSSTNAQNPGIVAFYNAADGTYLNSVNVGYLPDMLTFTPDGTKVLTADEGEPNSYGMMDSFDPEGSVSIIDISGGVMSATVQIAGFTAFNSQLATLKAAGVRIFGPGASVAQDLEPEYIAVSPDGSTAMITLQENNAFALLDIASATITQIVPLGLKDMNATGNSFDASDQDGGINMQNWPVKGMYQPDAIAAYAIGNNVYYITANEGDSRDAYPGFNEEIRVNNASYPLDASVFPDAATLKMNANLGRLQVTRATGDTNDDGFYDEIHMFGARSFSIWNAGGAQVYDSGNAIETILKNRTPQLHNSEGTAASFDTRSDNKGAEPEGVAIGSIGGRSYAFIGLERTGDVIVYDVTDPLAPVYIQYVNLPEDLNVEGLIFVSAENSPTGLPLLITAAEVSKTITVYEIGRVIVTNTANDGAGTLRAAIDCVVEGGIITYDQEAVPPVESTLLTDHLDIYKSVTIKGLSATQKPEITVNFSGITTGYGISILTNKTVKIQDVDFQDINNATDKAVIEVRTDAVLEIPGSTQVQKN
jgi:hypothetical protein